MSLQTILIVDDEPANLAIMEDALADSYKLAFARNGRETLAAVAKHCPAMVLLDIGLPDINGYDLCRQIKKIDSTGSVQVIFVTAYTDTAHEEAGFDAGGVDYLIKPVSTPIVRARVATHLSLVRATLLEKSYRDAILMLGQAGHFNDTDTGAHIWRMAAYARALAQGYGWSEENSERLELAAPMHDTGKIGIPQGILRKPGPLDEQEWVVMRTHPQIGYNILSKSDAPVFQLAAEVALRHHEKWDGSGYPDGLRRKDIPESARIVALADVFDALSMRRPYKEPWPIEKILGYVNASSGQHFDPKLVDVFSKILPQLLDIQSKWASAEDKSILNQSSTTNGTDAKLP
ncbi:HD domain-containing phosphohydrolase [Solimicrobium silvestre]|uniref:Response regulator containing a CheY-like receiver domain and an HD-GYP domain n=1 Tax=Solimicrobium silvestre TaxID=2099400 RepID=A0A2S9H2Z0_9BURK|nr:HD domain-containing phosphohydrolase [Solimicrobium silvestre]PRC94344.1 Response regulator containing a CheY-like receiver domain and an HD-GYP domain [Solimicrobium silvestre]